MSVPARPIARLCAAFALLVPLLAAAWTPYGSDPAAGEGQPGWGSAPAMGYGPTTPYPGYGPPWAGPEMGDPSTAGPGGGMPGPFPSYGPPWASPPEGFGGPPAGYGPGGGGFPPGSLDSTRPAMQINRRATEDAYLIDIELRNVEPGEVQVQTQGRWLSIGRDTSAEEVRREQFDEGRGYMHSYSYSAGTTSRRMVLPPDADPAGMQREERENGLTIRIPRKGFSGPEGGAGY